MNTTTRPTLTPPLLAVLALLSAFTPLSIDMYLPALPVIAVDLRSSAGDIQLTLSAFMIAFGVGQIFYGPAGDRFGRRPVILIGLLIYVLTSIGCAFAAAGWPSHRAALPAGLAACGGVVLARTMVRDLAEKDHAARAMSLMMACTSIAPMLAPVIGGQVMWFAGWRAIFWVLASAGVIAFIVAWFQLPETFEAGIPSAAGVHPDPEAVRRAPEHAHPFMGYALTSAFMFAALFSYISGVAVRLHRALRDLAALLRRGVRRHGDLHDHRQPVQCAVRAPPGRRAHPARRG
jgi:DHA1 family bicyclomycin/chloramphenicol resistance-like MFS transporter